MLLGTRRFVLWLCLTCVILGSICFRKCHLLRSMSVCFVIVHWIRKKHFKNISGKSISYLPVCWGSSLFKIPSSQLFHNYSSKAGSVCNKLFSWLLTLGNMLTKRLTVRDGLWNPELEVLARLLTNSWHQVQVVVNQGLATMLILCVMYVVRLVYQAW